MIKRTARKQSSFHKINLALRAIKWGFAGIGVCALMLALLLAINQSLRTRVGETLLAWADYGSENDFVSAPFEPEMFSEDQHNVPDGLSKMPIQTLASLPVLDPTELSAQQNKLSYWIANRYRVAPELVARLVQEAWNIGERNNIDPTLLLAIIAIESRFNPYAQSAVGASGLMQVMTKVHSEKFERSGGTMMAFDPVTNLRVGVLVLQEHIQRAGSLEGGLKQYVGATGPDDYGYAAKVLAERNRIRRVMFGDTALDLNRILLASSTQNRPASAAATSRPL